MRILIADDNQRVRHGLVCFLSNETECEVCGEASDAEEAIRMAGERRPDVILLDVSMPGTNGLNAARLLRQRVPESKILILSQHDPRQLLPFSLEVGAVGCIDKARIATDLMPAIRKMLVRQAS
jgi:DNA-binding NarL/FixJ family response regulator